MGSVYRNLGILVDQGMINRIDCGSTFARYDAKILAHHHFICETCGGVSDLDIPVSPELNDLVNASGGFDAVSHEMRFDGNSGRAKNYEPNSFGGPVQTNAPTYAPIEVKGYTGSFEWEKHPDDDDFKQAGSLYRVMDAGAKDRLVNAIAGSLSRVSKNDIIERSVSYFRKADPEYGERVEKKAR